MQVDSKDIKKFSPDISIDSSLTFGMKKKMKIAGFKDKSALVPTIDENYIFDEEIKFINSERVRSSVRNIPSILLVTVDVSDLCTPLVVIH